MYIILFLFVYFTESKLFVNAGVVCYFVCPVYKLSTDDLVTVGFVLYSYRCFFYTP